MSKFGDFIQVFVFTSYHHLKLYFLCIKTCILEPKTIRLPKLRGYSNWDSNEIIIMNLICGLLNLVLKNAHSGHVS